MRQGWRRYLGREDAGMETGSQPARQAGKRELREPLSKTGNEINIIIIQFTFS